MEWTRELRYKPYEAWGAKTLLDLQAQASGSDYKLGYHIMPTSGLLNDPNGFSYYNGYWHVFYQSYPFGPVHGLKSWNHMRSKDLVHWENLGLGLNPDFEYDKTVPTRALRSKSETNFSSCITVIQEMKTGFGTHTSSVPGWMRTIASKNSLNH